MERKGLRGKTAGGRWNRLLSILLLLAMLAGLLPGTARAAEEPEEQYGVMRYYSTVTGDWAADGWRYSDRWFFADAAERNEPLALLSAQLAAAAAEEAGGAAFLDSLGFQTRAKGYDGGDPDGCAYVLGIKTIRQDGAARTLVAAAFQGSEYGGNGWRQNVSVNAGTAGEADDHAAYSAAAKAFLADYDGLGLSCPVTVWLTGQSRGGAVANLAAAYLLNRDPHPAVFARTFESPAAASGGNDPHGAAYAPIHNYICGDDPVPMLPIWGMTRYGQDFSLDSGGSGAVTDALDRLNPDAGAAVQGYDGRPFGGDVSAWLRELTSQLAGIIPRRADYSARQTDSFTAEGTVTEISYVYEDSFRALCRLAFEGEKSLTETLTPLLSEQTAVPALVYSYLEERAAEADPARRQALLNDAVRKRWEAAGVLWGLLAQEPGGPACDREAVYGMLKVLRPLLLSPGAGTDPLPAFDGVFIRTGFLSHLNLSVLMNLNTLAFSHQSDVILARLHLLAPDPELGNIALTVPEPEAGEGAEVTPAAVLSAADALSPGRLRAKEVRWLTEETRLSGSRISYLSVTLAAAGRSVPEDFRFTLNGRAPVSLTAGREDGETLVTGVWAFRPGTPEQAAVRFDAGGRGDAPAAWSVDAGTKLKYAGRQPDALATVTDSGGTWRFDGWYDRSGRPWDQVTVTRDVTLYAAWTRLVDSVELTFPIPRAGETGVTLSMPEGAPCRLDGIRLRDARLDPVTAVGSDGPMYLEFSVFPAAGRTEFLTGTDETGSEAYLGTLRVNGADAADVSLGGRGGEARLTVRYAFSPLPAASSRPASPAGGSVTAVTWAPEGGSCVERRDAGVISRTETDAGGRITLRSVEIGETALSGGIPGQALDALTAVDLTACGPEGAVVDVKTPEGSGPPDLAVTVKGASAGTVAAVLRADGVREIVKDAVVVDGGRLIIPLRGSGRVQIFSGAGEFTDVPETRWSHDAVAFVTARGIFGGTGADRFRPEMTATRGMLMTVLARYDGEEISGADWKRPGMAWSVARGVSDGTDPDAPVTREQLVTMLWRYAGEPASSGSLDQWPDAGRVADYAAAAVAWAVDQGILNGTGTGCLDPQGTAAREQAAQLIMNFVKR